MKYDIESILEMYEDDYTPSAKVPGPRNMKLAEVPRSEMDNFNTPDLDQGADSILRPGETLEDFDVEFRRPNAQGGVQQLVQPSGDGSRPGYSGKYGPNIRKLTQSDTLEVQIIRGGTGGGKGGQKFYKTLILKIMVARKTL